MEYEEEIREYCKKRISQVAQYEPILRFFGAKHYLSGYYKGLNEIIREIDGRNDDQTKRQNITWLIVSNDGCGLFLDDIHSLLSTGKTVLPQDDIFQIPVYQEEQRRKEEEIRRQLEDARRAEEARIRAERWRREDEERKQRERKELCEKLGISPQALAKLQQVG